MTKNKIKIILKSHYGNLTLKRTKNEIITRIKDEIEKENWKTVAVLLWTLGFDGNYIIPILENMGYKA